MKFGIWWSRTYPGIMFIESAAWLRAAGSVVKFDTLEAAEKEATRLNTSPSTTSYIARQFDS